MILNKKHGSLLFTFYRALILYFFQWHNLHIYMDCFFFILHLSLNYNLRLKNWSIDITEGSVWYKIWRKMYESEVILLIFRVVHQRKLGKPKISKNVFTIKLFVVPANLFSSCFRFKINVWRHNFFFYTYQVLFTRNFLIKW